MITSSGHSGIAFASKGFCWTFGCLRHMPSHRFIRVSLAAGLNASFINRVPPTSTLQSVVTISFEASERHYPGPTHIMSARQVTANPALAVTGGSTATPSGSTTFTPTVSGTPNLFSGVQTTTAATPRFSFGGSSRTRIFSSTWQDATVKANSKRSGRPMTRHEEHSEPQTQTVELPATSLRRNLTSAPM